MTQYSSKAVMSRRAVLGAAGTGLVAVAGTALAARTAQAAPADVQAKIGEIPGGAAAKEGKVTVKLPQIAENGRTVPLTVTVDSPQTEADHVKRIHVLSEGNPTPLIAYYDLSPQSGKAEIATRIRLAKTQNVVAVAEMSDGSVWTGKKQVKVTIGGCGG